MRRVWMILLSLLVLTVPARAAEEKWVALTFDDGPSGALTEQLLDGLSVRSIHATFFVCGYRVAQYPAALRRIAADGHEIGLHSDKHDYMQHMTFAEVTDDLTRWTRTCSVRRAAFTATICSAPLAISACRSSSGRSTPRTGTQRKPQPSCQPSAKKCSPAVSF